MRLFSIFVLLVSLSNLHAEVNAIENIFTKNNVEGSILIESEDGKTKYQHNVNKKERFIPASTFKIPNTLIILEEGLIRDESEIIKWDKKEREYEPWNKDQTLKTAFQISCVWCYQRYAKLIGDEKYQSYLKKFNYGNQLTGPDTNSFWLDGDIRISINEQINFLRKVYFEELPIEKRHIKTLKNIMLSDIEKHYKIWSKTGWSGTSGWYVGYLITNKQTWFFATHIKINNKSDLKFRKKLTLETFNNLKLIQ